MTRQPLLSLTAAMVLLLLPFDSTAAQDDPQVFPPEIVADVQTQMDDLTAGGLPPGITPISSPRWSSMRRQGP